MHKFNTEACGLTPCQFGESGFENKKKKEQEKKKDSQRLKE
jgi:hypothetical protein